MNRKLYWTDAEDNDIEVMDPLTTHRKVLISTGNATNPRAIVVDPKNKYVNETTLSLGESEACVIHTASDDSYGGGLGTRLGLHIKRIATHTLPVFIPHPCH